MEGRTTDTFINMDENMKSQHHSISVYSPTQISQNSNGSCSCIDHNFKSSTSSCSHSSYNSSTNTNTNTSINFSTISNITLKSNSPAIMIPNNRRNSVSINNGDILDNNLTVFQLSNSETLDTKDVYVMAKETKQKHNLDENTNTTNNNEQHVQSMSLAVPKWRTYEIEESADEYDSEAHTITDEDIIIKRVLAKFNQQNQQIIRRKLSFVDSFQYSAPKPICYRYRNTAPLQNIKNDPKKRKKKKKKKRKKKKKKKFKKKKIQQQSTIPGITRDHSESDPTRKHLNNKLSEGHQQLLQEIRRATINEAPPSSTQMIQYTKQSIFTNSKKCKRKRPSHAHTRTITPFDPVTLDFNSDNDNKNDEDHDEDDYHKINNINKTKHKKTLTAIMPINLQLQHSNTNSHHSPSTTRSMNTPEPFLMTLNSNNSGHGHNGNNTNTNIRGSGNSNHRKTMSHGPRLMSTTCNTRRTASIIPTMEEIDDAFLSNIFIDIDDDEDWDEDDIMIDGQPRLMNSTSSPPMLANATVTMTEKKEIKQKEIKQKEWNELGTLNEASDEEDNNIEYMDDDMDDIKEIDFAEIKTSTKRNKHRRLISAPVVVGNDKNVNKKEKRDDLHIYQTWNYFEEMSDSLKSDYNSDDMNTDSDTYENHIQTDEDDVKTMDDVTFGTERVFSTFTKELALTSENPRFIFESLSEICVSLRSKEMSSKTIKHKITFDSPILRYERVVSFLKLLGFTHNFPLSAYIITKIDVNCIDAALSSCQQQLIEISKKSATYQVIVTSRLRHHDSIPPPPPPIPPPPPPIEENKSDKYCELQLERLSDIDADRCQLYELIWSATHPSNTDHKAKDVILLCFILITTPLKFIKLLEARFFNDDHGRASRSYSTSTDSNFMGYMPIPIPSPANGSPTCTIPTVGSSLPSSVPSLNTSMNSSITFDYERIQSSYGVQKKVIHMIRLWMQKYWLQDWHNNHKLLSYVDVFVRKANKAYQNDIDFDVSEMNKGFELVSGIHKTIQKQKADVTFQQTPITSVRPRSISNNTGIINRNNEKGNNEKVKQTKECNNPQRRKSLHKHKRKFSLLSSPRAARARSSNLNVNKGIPNDLLKIPNELICNQLVLYLLNKYGAINARECLYQYSPIHKHKENICPNIQFYKDTFNNIVKWVQSSILLQQQVAKRARIIKKWIKITDLLFNIRCFQGFVAVQCALASNAIYTLKDAWNQHNVLKRKHHTKFKEIKVIMSASHNFENLRRLQREAHAPLIPYFGIFCKDLIYVQEGVSKRNQDGMINWSKLWRISELIKDHLTYQNNSSYNRIIKKDECMQNWLQIELKRSGTLKTEHIDKMASDVAQKDKNKKIRHKKSFTLMQ